MGSPKLYSKTSQLIQAGKVDDAIELVRDEKFTSQVINVQINHLNDEYDKSIELATQIMSDPNFPLYDKIISNYWYAWNYIKIGNYGKALEIANKSFDLIEHKDGDDFIHAKAYLYNIRGVVHKESGQIAKGMEYAQIGLELAKKTVDLRFVASMSNNLASVYFFQGEYKKSLELFKEAAEVARKANNKRIASLAYANIGEIYQSLGDLNLAKSYLQDALKISNHVGNTTGIANIKRKLADIAYQRGNFDLALQLLDDSINIYKGIQNEFYLGFAYLSKIKLLVTINEPYDELLLDFEILAKNSKNQILLQVLNLSHAFVLKSKDSMLQRGRAMIFLEKIIQDKILLFETTFEATIHYIELLIQEYIITESREKLTRVIEMVNKIYTIAREKNASIKEINCLVLKSKLEAISLDHTQAIESLNLAREIARDANLNEFRLKIDLELSHRQEELQKYQVAIDSNSSLLEKVQHSGLMGYVKSLVHIYEE